MAEENKIDLQSKKEDEKGQEGDPNSNQEPSEENKIDYEAELKREKDRVVERDKIIADQAFKLRDKKRNEEEDEIEDEDKPLTAKQLNDILHKDREKTRKELQSEIISEKTRKLAGSDSESNLIIEIHKNRSFPEGMPLDEQLEEAYAIANRKTIMAKNEELKRALRSKENTSDNPAGTHRDSTPLDEPKISSSDISAIKAAGFVWDGKSRLYIKQLSGGKRILTYDPKLKTQKVINKS